MSGILPSLNQGPQQSAGLTHLAISVGTQEVVDQLTGRERTATKLSVNRDGPAMVITKVSCSIRMATA